MGSSGGVSRVRTAGIGLMPSLVKLRAQVREQLGTTRLIRAVLEGSVTREQYAGYLINVWHYARFSPVIMAQAASRLSMSHPELALYLLSHASDEHGHDDWALRDLAELAVAADTVRATPATPACAALVGYVRNLVTHGDAVAVFGWMYILEGVGADLGTLAGKQLKAGFSSTPEAVRFVAGHGVADTDHTVEIEEQIVRNVAQPEDAAAVAEAARVVADLYVTMFRQIGGETPSWH